MKIRNHPNTTANWTCPICNTADDEPVTLVKIDGTRKGWTVECRQYHVECIKLTEMWFVGAKYLVQKVPKNDEVAK